LVNLLINKNKINKIVGLEQLSKLEDLTCNNNRLAKLDVSGLTNLININASHNNLSAEKCSIFLNITMGNNPNLIILDLAENNLLDLNFPYLPSLRMLSLRENFLGFSIFPVDSSMEFLLDMKTSKPSEILYLNSPKLSFLDYTHSDIKEVKHLLGCSDNLMICNDESYKDKDGKTNYDIATA
jgi:hypothetical protein